MHKKDIHAQKKLSILKLLKEKKFSELTQKAILTVIFDSTEPNPVIHAAGQMLVTKSNEARLHLSGDLDGSFLFNSFINDRNLSK